MAGIGKLIQKFAYTPNGPEPIIALREKDVPYSLPRLRFRIRHSVENKATDLGLQNRVERFPLNGGGTPGSGSLYKGIYYQIVALLTILI